MYNVIKHSEDLIPYITNVILKYCPYLDDRLLILGNAKAPQLDIEININNNSQILILFGNDSFKSSVPERTTVSYTISFEEIGRIIDFILEDHEVIRSINIFGNRFDLKFAINWTDKSIKGINCGDIGLNLKFDSIDLERQYLYLLFQRYYTYLERIPSFKAIKNEYINTVKQSYFGTLDKNRLITFLNRMSETELKELLNNLDNDAFIKHVVGDVKQTKVKVLSLEEQRKNI